jgi:hypothetical protein
VAGAIDRTGNSKSKAKDTAGSRPRHSRQPSVKDIRKSLTQGVDLAGVKGVNQMAVQRDYNKPLTEEEPYLVQVIAFANC